MSGWEAGALKALSRAFIAEYQAAADPRRAAPFRAVEFRPAAQQDAELRIMFDRLERRDAPNRPSVPPEDDEAIP